MHVYFHQNRTTTNTRKPRSHQPEQSPNFYRRNLTGGLNRAPGSAHSMEFLRGIYAFMQVSRSSVRDTIRYGQLFSQFFNLDNLGKFHMQSKSHEISWFNRLFLLFCSIKLVSSTYFYLDFFIFQLYQFIFGTLFPQHNTISFIT